MADEPARERVPASVPAPPTPRSEALLLAKAAAGGDVRATKRLLELVAPRVVRAARAVMGPGHPDLQDATQLALIGFIQALPTFRGECDPAQFAARIAVRCAGAVRRRARTHSMACDGAVDLDTIEGAGSDLAAARRRAIVRMLLDELPEAQAEALALRVALGWSLKEIADATSTPLNTVRSRLRLAKEALRRRIGDDPTLADELETREADA